jgi:hypothetical protein
MRECDDGYPACRKAEAGGEWCKNECLARDAVQGNVNGLAIMRGGRLVDVAALESLLREVKLALNELLEKKPMLGAMRCGTTTLGNLRAMVHGEFLSVQEEQSMLYGQPHPDFNGGD